MINVEPSFVLYALLLDPGCCLRAHIALIEPVEPGEKKIGACTNMPLPFGAQKAQCGLHSYPPPPSPDSRMQRHFNAGEAGPPRVREDTGASLPAVHLAFVFVSTPEAHHRFASFPPPPPLNRQLVVPGPGQLVVPQLARPLAMGDVTQSRTMGVVGPIVWVRTTTSSL